MASDFKSHTSYLILDQICSHIFDHSLSEKEHNTIIDSFKKKNGDWAEVVNGNPEQMQKLISCLKVFMKNLKKRQTRVQ